jgi:predicted dehydrogenase
MRKRYAVIGLGGRGFGMFARPLVEEYADVAEVVAFCDVNRHRMNLANRMLGTSIATYTDAAAMIAEARPDAVAIATVDRTHHTYIIQALEAGCEVITEKPMTTTAENVRAILDAERRTGGKVKVSFNARYGPPEEELKRQLNAGVIGSLVSVDFAEYLDTEHGADYFRRWHRQKANSGGLLIHKATHHFDQLNWWIGAQPETVYALGATRFYGPQREARGERCLTCAHAGDCEFYLDLRANDRLRALYLEAEHEDGYYRDRCVFSEQIDAEDTMAVVVRYENGVLLNYSLNAFMPYEGQRIGFNGTRGRMEVDLVRRYHGVDEAGNLGIQTLPVPRVVRVNPLFGRPYEVPVPHREGGHGGADVSIRDHLFREGVPDPLAQKADSWAGAMSVLIGAAANRSIATGQPVAIRDLLQG